MPWPIDWRTFDSASEELWLTRTRNLVDAAGAESLRQRRLREGALGASLASVAGSVDASTLPAFASQHFQIDPFIPPDDGDLFYVKINHGFWEQIYWVFGGDYDPTRMRVEDPSHFRAHYADSGFLEPLQDLIGRALSDDGREIRFADVHFGVNLSGGMFDHATVLSSLTITPDNRVMVGSAIGLTAYFHALCGPRKIHFCEGSFAKHGVATGALRSCLQSFAAKSEKIIFVVPPHLRGIRLADAGIPQEVIFVSGTLVHESWAASLYVTTRHILEQLDKSDAIMVLTQSAVFSAVLGLFLKEAKNAFSLLSKRIYFFDLGQVLDIANPLDGGPWLKNNEVRGDLSLFHMT